MVSKCSSCGLVGAFQARRGEGRARLAKSDREQTRAKHHEARCGYRKEAIGPEVMIAHGHHLSLGNTVSTIARLLAQNDCQAAQSKGFQADPKSERD